MKNVDNTSSANAHPSRAVLFADVSGSTRLYDLLGDARAFAMINDCINILRGITNTCAGRTVKTIGDEIMSVFPDASFAVRAACEMQLAMSALPLVDDTRIAIRIGFHFGPILENPADGDVFGDTVNVAARMTGLAKGEQIITTGSTVAMLPAIMRASTRTFNSLSIKGKLDDIEVREIIWQQNEEMTMMASNTFTPKTTEPYLELFYQGVKYVVNAARPSIIIGRDEHADIVIQDRRASRIHARIEHRRDKFVYIDLSSNGSYININDESEIELRREELVFRESGNISLGHAYQADPSEVVSFVHYC